MSLAARFFSRQSRRGFSVALLQFILTIIAGVAGGAAGGIEAYKKFKEPGQVEALKDENRKMQAEVEKWKAEAQSARAELSVQMGHEKTLGDYLPNRPSSKTIRELIRERDDLLLQDSSLRDGIDRNASAFQDLIKARIDAAVDPAKRARER